MSDRLVIPRTKRDQRAGYVYLISEPFGLYKIGHATNVQVRFNTLQLACPYDLVLLASVNVKDRHVAESFIHGLLATYHVRGEWYRLPDGKTTFDEAIRCYRQHLKTKIATTQLATDTSFNNYSQSVRDELARRPA